jgi:hypothetical protein
MTFRGIGVYSSVLCVSSSGSLPVAETEHCNDDENT